MENKETQVENVESNEVSPVQDNYVSAGEWAEKKVAKPSSILLTILTAQAVLAIGMVTSNFGIFDWLLGGDIKGDDDGSVRDAIRSGQVKKVGDDLYSVKTGRGNRRLVRKDDNGEFRASGDMKHDEYEQTIQKVKSGKRFKLW